MVNVVGGIGVCGVVIELVKNGYDADSRYCIVLIDNKYGVYHRCN